MTPLDKKINKNVAVNKKLFTICIVILMSIAPVPWRKE